MSDDKAVFLASFPPIQSAIKVDGAGNGMRIQLDIPESEMGNAVEIIMWREKRLKITVEVIDGFRNGEEQTNQRTAVNPLELDSRRL